MIVFPIAKINLGLNVVARRQDGYHDLQTVFYPVPISDAIEVLPMHRDFPSTVDCDLKISNMSVECDEQQNLVVKAYRLLKHDFGEKMGRVHVHLHKAIPTQAGMGGGSSDGAYMLLLLNEMFALQLTERQLIDYATRLGADCPFFVLSRPAYAEGIGERLRPMDLNLRGLYMVVVRPDIPVSTREAFSLIKPCMPAKNCGEVILQPIDTWRKELTNDFEQSVGALHPEIMDIKQELYDMGAVYAAMSGSGSAVFGLFRSKVELGGKFDRCFTYAFSMPDISRTRLSG